jgi:hypothetical protein
MTPSISQEISGSPLKKANIFLLEYQLERVRLVIFLHFPWMPGRRKTSGKLVPNYYWLLKLNWPNLLALANNFRRHGNLLEKYYQLI